MSAKQPKQKTPSGLGMRAAKLWRDVTEAYVMEPHHAELLEQAARCLDRIDAAREIIDRDGVVVRDRFGQAKENPACNVEVVNKRMFKSLLRELQLDIAADAEEYTRPPRLPDSGRRPRGR